MPHTVIATQRDDEGNVIREVEVERLSHAEIANTSRAVLNKRMKPRSEGGTVPDGMSREDWRVTQGAYYDDDRC